MIGSLGDIVFEASIAAIKTFRDLHYSNNANYASHKVLTHTELLEYTGRNASTCTFTMTLSAIHGAPPDEVISELYALMEDHEALDLMLGGELQGQGMWVIEGIDEVHREVNNYGETTIADVTVKLKEYVNEGQ